MTAALKVDDTRFQAKLLFTGTGEFKKAWRAVLINT